MLAIVLFMLLALEAHAAPEVCGGVMCGNFEAPGLTNDYYCPLSDENLVLILPPGVASSAQHCESYCKESPVCGWYNFRDTGSCELLSFCKMPVEENGSVTGPDPGEGESCHTFTTMEPTTTTESSTTTDPTTTKTPGTTPPPQEVVLVIGGSTNLGVSSSVEIITEDLTVIAGAVPDVPVADGAWTAGAIEDQVVLCGGTQNPEMCYHLNLTVQSWSRTSVLKQPRWDTASVVLDGDMYLFGGYNSGFLTGVERYYEAFNDWSSVPEWTMPEGNRRFCAVQYGEHIYHIGGWGVSDSRVTRRLSIVTNEYETLEDMFEGRSGAACVQTSIGGEEGILMTGGDYHMALSSTEFYSFSTEKWHRLADMNFRRMFHGLEIINGKPVVFGGLQPLRNLDSLEVYSQTEDKWLLVDDSTLTQPRLSFAYVKVPWKF